MSTEIALEPVHHVVCGVESEEMSAPAVAVAARIAVPLGARLSLVHVSGTAARFSGGSTARSRSAEDLQADLIADAHAWLDPLAVRMNGEGVVIVGDDLADALKRWVREAGGDLIVICPHRRGLAARLLGSFARGIVADPPCPVVLAPPD
jgi:nucleotide-binding universal stress UspA family protein